MRKQELQLRAGWRINTENGMCERASEDCMITFLFFSVYEGSVLSLNSSDYEFKVFYYSKNIPETYIYTYSYQDEQQWTTYQSHEFVEEWIRGQVAFDKERYIRLAVRRIDGCQLTEMDIKKVTESLVLEYPIIEKDDYLKQPDVQRELHKTIETIKQLRTEDSLVFTLLSDTHYVVNGNWDHTAETISAVNKVVHPDGVIHLGDLADGILDKELCDYYSHQVIDKIKEMQLPFYLAIGNHDTNYFRNNPERLSDKEQYELFLKNVVNGKCEENKLWYYVDYPEQKLRFLFLHSFDITEQVRYGFPMEEIEWVRNRLDELPEDYLVILFSHDAPLARLDYWAAEIRNGESLTEYLEEWHKTHGERILAFIHGHTHADYIYTERAFPIVSVGCSKCEYFPDKKPEGSIRYRREMGTVQESLWDTMIIHPKEKRIDFVRFGAGVDRSIEAGKKRGNRMTQIWAHRGASGYAPENTLEAFALAIQMEADGIELDVQFTKDRQLVVLHDERIDRTSDHAGFVVDYTLEELKEMNFNNHHPEYPMAKIPTLREVLELIKPTRLIVNIELKTGINFYDGIEQAVVSLVEEMGMQDRVIYSSFNHESVMRVKKICPTAKTGFLYSNGIYNVADYANQHGVYALHPSVVNMQYERLVEECKEKRIKLHVWTVNHEDEMRALIDAEMDAIITNYPDVARRILQEEREKSIAVEGEIFKEENEKIILDEQPGADRVKKKKPLILHAMGIAYSKVRKVFVKIDQIVQEAARR